MLRCTKRNHLNWIFKPRCHPVGFVIPVTPDYTATLVLDEQHLYGSQRLGVVKKAVVLHQETFTGSMGADVFTYTVTSQSSLTTASVDPERTALERGHTRFELSNHLGNVLAVISDRKLSIDNNTDGSTDYYEADVASAQDYYPFGMQMPGRSYTNAAFASGEYRFGFNGMEQDNELYGDGNAYDFGARVSDTRVGRFFSRDPKESFYPFMTPYCFAANNPIYFLDENGEGPVHPGTGKRVSIPIGKIEDFWIYSVGEPSKDIHGVKDQRFKNYAKEYSLYYDLYARHSRRPDPTGYKDLQLAWLDEDGIPTFDEKASNASERWIQGGWVKLASESGTYVFTVDKWAWETYLLGVIKIQRHSKIVYKVENNLITQEAEFRLKSNSYNEYYLYKNTFYDVSDYAEIYAYEVDEESGDIYRVKVRTYDVTETVVFYNKNGDEISSESSSSSKQIVIGRVKVQSLEDE